MTAMNEMTHPWGKFLAARADAIDWMYAEGDDEGKIARILSMDEQQVHLIRSRSRESEPLPSQMLEALDITRDAVAAQADAYVESEALALLRELNDALAIPGWLQPRVDAVLDRAEEKT